MNHQIQILLALLVFSSNLNALSGILGKAIYYSFDVPIHLEKTYQSICYGIEDDSVSKLLITNCGGYLNVIDAVITLGLLKSNATTRNAYTSAAQSYLDEKSQYCLIESADDLGGRIFEITYSCIPSKTDLVNRGAQ